METEEQDSQLYDGPYPPLVELHHSILTIRLTESQWNSTHDI